MFSDGTHVEANAALQFERLIVWIWECSTKSLDVVCVNTRRGHMRPILSVVKKEKVRFAQLLVNTGVPKNNSQFRCVLDPLLQYAWNKICTLDSFLSRNLGILQTRQWTVSLSYLS